MRQSFGPVTRFFTRRSVNWRFLGTCATLAASAVVAGCMAKPPASGGGTAAAKPVAKPVEAVKTVDVNAPVLVALLAPTTATSDRARGAAQDMAAAAQMARSDVAPENLILKVYDTHGTPEGAATAAENAMRDNAALIIGPLFAATTRTVAPVAKAKGVNVLSFSSDASVAGDNVWVLGALPSDELRRVLSYAAGQGVTQTAIFHPENPYGQRIAQTANEVARSAGVGIGPISSYPRTFKGIEAASRPAAEAIIANGANGVVIADAGKALRSAAAFLNYYDVSPRDVKYLGLSRWADKANTKENSLIGAWFAAPDPEQRTAFARDFNDTMGRVPTPLAGIAYEAMTAASAMLNDAKQAGGATDGPFTAEAITRARGFAGVSGPFLLTADGENRRALAVMEVTKNGLVVIDPAPAAGPAS